VPVVLAGFQPHLPLKFWRVCNQNRQSLQLETISSPRPLFPSVHLLDRACPINAFTREVLPADPCQRPLPAIRRELSSLQSPASGSVKLAATLHPESVSHLLHSSARFFCRFGLSWDLRLSAAAAIAPHPEPSADNRQPRRSKPPVAQSATTVADCPAGENSR